jgi:hypothetical protein
MLKLLLEAQVINPKKGVVRSKAWVSKSFVKNFLHLLYNNMITGTAVTATDIDGTPRTATGGAALTMLRCPQAYGGQRVYAYNMTTEYFGEDLGVLVGDGSAANTALTYTLHQQIAHGTASGKLEYAGGFFGQPVVSGSDTYFDIERIFRNSSGGDVVVKEYGIAVLWQSSTYSDYPILIVRDVFTDPGDWVTVANGEYFKVTYRLLVTV